MSKTSLPFKTAYGPRSRVQLSFTQPSLAKQSFKAECDINGIMSKYEKTGLITHVKENKGAYGDFLGVMDYQESLNHVMAAQEAFNTLPSSIRKRFENDPSAFLSFVQNPDNLDEMIELGLAKRPVQDIPPEKLTKAEKPVTEPAE